MSGGVKKVKLLHSDARDIVFSVYKYFLPEHSKSDTVRKTSVATSVNESSVWQIVTEKERNITMKHEVTIKAEPAWVQEYNRGIEADHDDQPTVDGRSCERENRRGMEAKKERKVHSNPVSWLQLRDDSSESCGPIPSPWESIEPEVSIKPEPVWLQEDDEMVKDLKNEYESNPFSETESELLEENGSCGPGSSRENVETATKVNRQRYIQALGYHLSKQQQASKNLPQQLKATNRNVIGITQQEGNHLPNGKPKQGRCSICPRSKDRKTKSSCMICQKLVCAEHKRDICVLCL